MSEAATFTILEDTRQQVGLPWPPGVVVERRTMPEADFTTEALWGIAAIELKRDDLPPAVGSDREGEGHRRAHRRRHEVGGSQFTAGETRRTQGATHRT